MQLNIKHINDVDRKWNENMYALALRAKYVPNSSLGSFWSDPLGATKAFLSHPAKTIAHDYTAKKITKTVRQVAPYAAGAAALFFAAPYVAAGASSLWGSISASTIGHAAIGAGTTALKWWQTQGRNAASMISGVTHQPSIQTAANRAGITMDQLLRFAQTHAGNIPPQVAAGGSSSVAQWMGQQALKEAGIGMNSASAQDLLAQRISAEQNTQQMADAGTLPSKFQNPNTPPIPAKKDWSKIALVGISGTGLLYTMMSHK